MRIAIRGQKIWELLFRPLLVLVLSLLVNTIQGEDIRIASRTGHVGKRLVRTEWHVAAAQLEAQIPWDGISTAPPLSIQAACKLCLPGVKERFPQVQTWLVHMIQMRNLVSGGDESKRFSYPNVWYYEITFCPEDQAEKRKLLTEFGDHPFTQVILFDGSVIPPLTTAQKEP